MKTLFIDSSRKSLSIALQKDDELLFVSNVDSYSKHSNYLMNEIKSILEKFDLKPNDIDNYVVLNGPGSFTGIRVGVTVCKTIAWTLSKKIYKLNNLEALKVGIEDDVVISVIPDKKNASYVGIYSDNYTCEDYLELSSDKLKFNSKNITLVSMEDNEYLQSLKDMLQTSNKVNVKIINDYDYLKVINYALSKQCINPHSLVPIYLKKIDAEKKKNEN